MSDQPSPPRRIPFWLVLSLMGNMLLVGLVIGMSVRSTPDRPDKAGWRSAEARHITSEDRRAMHDFMRNSFEATREAREDREAVRRRLADALRAEPYDEDAVRQAFHALREADETVHAAAHEAMITRMKDMPPERRAAMAEFLSRGPDGRGRRFRHKED